MTRKKTPRAEAKPAAAAETIKTDEVDAAAEVEAAKAEVVTTKAQLEEAVARATELERRLRGGDLDVTPQDISAARAQAQYLEMRLECTIARYREAEEKLKEHRGEELWRQKRELKSTGLGRIGDALADTERSLKKLVSELQDFDTQDANIRRQGEALIPEGMSAADPELPLYVRRLLRDTMSWEWPGVVMAVVPEFMSSLSLVPKYEELVRETARVEDGHQLKKLREAIASVPRRPNPQERKPDALERPEPGPRAEVSGEPDKFRSESGTKTAAAVAAGTTKEKN